MDWARAKLSTFTLSIRLLFFSNAVVWIVSTLHPVFPVIFRLLFGTVPNILVTTGTTVIFSKNAVACTVLSGSLFTSSHIYSCNHRGRISYISWLCALSFHLYTSILYFFFLCILLILPLIAFVLIALFCSAVNNNTVYIFTFLYVAMIITGRVKEQPINKVIRGDSPIYPSGHPVC